MWGTVTLAGLIELYGIMITQGIVVVAFGIHYCFTAPDTRSRYVLLLPIPTMILNSIIVYLIHACCLLLASWIHGLQPFDVSFSDVTRTSPSSNRVLKELSGAVLIFEILFYFGHRLMHRPRLYKLFHERYHRFAEAHSQQVPFALFYTHPVQSLFTFSLPIVAAALQRSHVFSLWLSGALANLTMMYLHTGKDISGIMSHERHIVHPKYNFGAVGILDWACGTLYASRGFTGLFQSKKRR
ncbi:C-4 methylsterol oxidase [Penicillium malachiteum]|uniref:C-4 methylsterol oxidase n=1 Tax=Penicillium malachiteum TaxID=1324776 RepID=UPI002547DCFD|nr:C-4 methylsterol oxidase [Penicillium malachiteum]KAJ5729748.1 C-4 methylsterol oxidase [Penicillium malachiteum]